MRNIMTTKKHHHQKPWLLLGACSLLLATSGFASAAAERHQAVAAMQPVGYWPADGGGGETLHDRSPNRNHGRIRHVQWDNGLLDFNGGYQWIDIPAHAAYEAPAFTIGGWIFSRAESYTDRGHAEGLVFIGDGAGQWARNHGHFNLRLKTNCEIEVISDRQPDVVGSRAGKIAVTPGRWEHLLYSFEDGTGKLYLNGQLVQSRDNIPGGLSRRGLLIGADASWWMVFPDGSRSLDGSVRDLVLFDRALAEHEVARLHQATRPAEQPKMPVEDEAVQEDPQAVASMEAILADEGRTSAQRAQAALALAAMGNRAESAVPLLAGMLDGVVEREGVRLPRIDDLLRNALIRALLDIAPQDERARQALGLALAKPVLDTLDLHQPVFAQIRPLVEENLYMDALDAYRRLELNELERRFFSQGAPQRDAREWQPNGRAYTGATTHNGHIYKVGEGEAWKGVEKISPEDFEAVVARVSKQYPEAATWRAPDNPHLYRVPITRIDPEGNEETVYLEGEDFIMSTGDSKYRGWSIAVDTQGYIHVTGGKHNRASPGAYIPGSWEKMGASTDQESDDYPQQMYWVSEEPGSLSFEFVGQRGNPRRMPPGYMNYMNFVQDRNGELFMYCRIDAAGIQSFGFYRYHTESRRWTSMDGDVHAIIANAEEHNPEWRRYLHSQRRGGVPTQPGPTAFVWAWQPHFYNYCRASFGVKFDPSNRMHVRMPIRGLVEDAQLVDADVYAWSDDLGQTFHRADGTTVAVPLTLNPVPNHNADAGKKMTKERWDLWISLLRDAGYSFHRW